MNLKRQFVAECLQSFFVGQVHLNFAIRSLKIIRLRVAHLVSCKQSAEIPCERSVIAILHVIASRVTGVLLSVDCA